MAAKTFTRTGGFLRFIEVGVVIKYYNLNLLQIEVTGDFVDFPDGNKYAYNDAELTNSFSSAENFADQVGTWKAEAQASSGGGTDPNAVHVNTAAEISGVTSKATPTGADFILIEDAADSNNKKKIVISALPETADSNAVHVNAANEITAITEKTSSDNQDEYIIEDSEDGFNKKSIKRKAIVAPIDNTTATASTLTPDIDENEQETVSALASALTIAAPTGTPSNGLKLIIRLTDNGTGRGLTFNAIYRAIGVTLPTTTTANKTIYIGCVYNATETKWDVIAIKEEA